MKKIIILWISLFFSILTVNSYADSAQENKTIFSIENAQFEILEVNFEGITVDGMTIKPTSSIKISNEQRYLYLSFKQISGEKKSPPLDRWVTDEKEDRFDHMTCFRNDNIIACGAIVNKTSHSFKLHFFNGPVVNLSPFLK